MSSPGFVLMFLAAASLCPGHARFIMEPLTVLKQESLMLDTCSECRQIVQLSANMISSRDTKAIVYETLHSLCRRFPGEQASACDSQVKMYLPKILLQTLSPQKSDETCVAFGLCAAPKEEQLKLPHHVSDKDTFRSAVGTAISSYEQLNPTCTLCVLVIKKLESLLPKNMTEDTLIKLMDEVCDLLPQSYKEECDDFVSKYGAEIVEFLLSSAAPHTICSLLHLCLFEEQQPQPEVVFPSDCESCRTLAVLSRLYLGVNATELQTSFFLQSVCAHHPNAIPKCEAFTKFYGSRLQRVLGNRMDVPPACERVDLCVASKKMEPLGKSRCTWGQRC